MIYAFLHTLSLRYKLTNDMVILERI